jgi:hypothetical protein
MRSLNSIGNGIYGRSGSFKAENHFFGNTNASFRQFIGHKSVIVYNVLVSSKNLILDIFRCIYQTEVTSFGI